MKLTPEDIRHVALLARLELAPEDESRYLEELGRILGYMDKLGELDTRDVSPTASVGQTELPRRPDVIAPCLPEGRALRNAPAKKDGYFVVPRVVE